nr:DUF1403 family protein [Aliihoeflea sp. 40Bstr573]
MAAQGNHDAPTIAPQGFGPNAIEDIALTAGAAIGALDQIVGEEEKWAGAWRQRLARTAAAVTTTQAGRVEDEAALRDAVLLTRLGDDVGPAGSLLLAWRQLAARPAGKLLTAKYLAAAPKAFGYSHDDEVISDLAHELGQLVASEGIIAPLLGASAIVQRHGFVPMVESWLADVLLAQRLVWTHAVPLLGTEMIVGKSAARSRRSMVAARVMDIELGSEQAKRLLAAQARAALRAPDLFRRPRAPRRKVVGNRS